MQCAYFFKKKAIHILFYTVSIPRVMSIMILDRIILASLTRTAACAWTLPTQAKTSGKYHHFQVKFYIMKATATIVRSHQKILFNPTSLDNKGSWRILKDFHCSVTMLRELGLWGKNGKGNWGKMLHFKNVIEHINVRGKMWCNRYNSDALMQCIRR